VEYLIADRLPPGFLLNNATIALQPDSTITSASWFGEEKTLAQLFRVASFLINFCKTDFFPIPKICDVVSPPPPPRESMKKQQIKTDIIPKHLLYDLYV
jgi:hypothetical protein